jgi:tetratricopeptide (TPR) repeat protein
MGGTASVFDALLPHVEVVLETALKIGLKTPTSVKLLEMRGGYLNVRGRYDHAYIVLSEALKIAQELWPEGNSATATVLNALGNSCYYQASYDKAESHYKDALILREALLEVTNPAIGTSLNNLATLSLSQGRYPESEQFFQRALKHRQSSLGYFHPDVATTACNLANLFLALGSFQKAEEYFLQALDIRRKTDARREFLTGWVLINYAELKLDQNQPARAIALLLEAITIFNDTVGMDHAYSLMAQHNLGKAHRALGNTKQSEEIFIEVIRRRITVFGDNHPDLGFSYIELGTLYQLMGDGSKATQLMRKGICIITIALGPTHPHTLLASIRFALQLATNNEIGEAHGLFSTAVPEIEALQVRAGVLHPDYSKYVGLCRAALVNVV